MNDDIENASFKMPRNCLKLQTNGENNFSLDLFANHPCPPKWKPLNACRKYAFEIQPEYSSNSSSSASYKAEAFTSQQGAPQTNVSKIFIKIAFLSLSVLKQVLQISNYVLTVKTNCFIIGISPQSSIDGLWQCSAHKFFCRGIVDPLDPYAYSFGSTKTSGCLDNDKICNRETDCESGIDELNCAKSSKFWSIGNKPQPVSIALSL